MPALLETAQQEVLQRRIMGASQERMLREFAEAMEVLTAQQPFVLALEDLQWSDTSTLELLSMLAQRQEAARLLVLGTYRPGDVLVREHPLRELPHNLQLRAQCKDMPLLPLTEAAVREYLAERFAGSTLPSQLAHPMHQRTEGHPLFLVNTTDYLVQQGLVVRVNKGWAFSNGTQDISDRVPDTLMQVITRHVERLQPTELQLLEVASIVGMTFSAAAATVGFDAEVIAVETRCEALARQEKFIQETGGEEWPDGTVSGQYRFRHALYQEVLASRVGAARRTQLHRLIGERKEAGYGEQAREIAGELAVHFERGRQLWKAVEYRQMAAENGFSRLASREVQEHLSHGLQQLEMLPETPDRIQYGLPMLTALATQPLVAPLARTESHHALQRARELAMREDVGPSLLPYVASLAAYTTVQGAYADALRYGEHCLALARQTGDPSLLGIGATIFPLFYQGDILRVQEIVTELEAKGAFATGNGQEETFMRSLNMHPRIGCLSAFSWSLWALGYPDRARAQSQQLLAIHRNDDYLLNRISSLSFSISLSHLCRDSQTCLCLRGTPCLSEPGFSDRLVGGLFNELDGLGTR